MCEHPRPGERVNPPTPARGPVAESRIPRQLVAVPTPGSSRDAVAAQRCCAAQHWCYLGPWQSPRLGHREGCQPRGEAGEG